MKSDLISFYFENATKVDDTFVFSYWKLKWNPKNNILHIFENGKFGDTLFNSSLRDILNVALF